MNAAACACICHGDLLILPTAVATTCRARAPSSCLRLRISVQGAPVPKHVLFLTAHFVVRQVPWDWDVRPPRGKVSRTAVAFVARASVADVVPRIQHRRMMKMVM